MSGSEQIIPGCSADEYYLTHPLDYSLCYLRRIWPLFSAWEGMGGTSQVRNNTNLDHRDGYRFLVMRLSAWLKLDSRFRGNDERCRLFRFARGAGSYGYPKVVIAKERSDCGNLVCDGLFCIEIATSH